MPFASTVKSFWADQKQFKIMGRHYENCVKFFFLWIVCVKWETQFWIIFVLYYWEVATNTDTVLFFSN